MLLIGKHSAHRDHNAARATYSQKESACRSTSACATGSHTSPMSSSRCAQTVSHRRRLICLAPQNSRTSVGLYRRAVFAEAGDAIQIEFVDGWADHPLLAKAFADKLVPLRKQLAAETGAEVPGALYRAQRMPCRTIKTPAPTGFRRPLGRARENLLAGRGPADPDPYAVDAKKYRSPRRRAGTN